MESDFRETLYTISKDGHRKWVYADLNWGSYRFKRLLVSIVLLVIYLSLPWITIDNHQAVFLDITQRRFVFFGNIFWATDTRFLFLLLGGLAFCLFFFSAILGRVWCGWACPETVFLEFVFRPIEYFFEGTPAQRRKRDQAPLSADKALRKIAKWSCYTIIAWYLASTALAYFLGRQNLIHMINGSPLENFSMFLLTLLMMGFLLFQFGWFREQFCTVVCPYARFQSVLLDQDSLIVGYDAQRGEPRGKLKKNSKEVHGDCIDCGACVRVCPTGIDIRNGLQLECIQCAACADACDDIMKQVGKPEGLVRYDTETAILGGKRRFPRPRVFLYVVVLVIYAVSFMYLFKNRALSEFTLTRKATGELFSISPNGGVINVFTLHVSNKDSKEHDYELQIEDHNEIKIVIPIHPIKVAAGGEQSFPVFFEVPQSILEHAKKSLEIELRADGHKVAEQEITIVGPVHD
jgi:cytochrome c oxidase accessory protein FixG